MRKPKTPTIRCAIYTRKSTEEGLDQEFNSLDAQREAAVASRATYGARLREAGYGPITTEIVDAPTFYYAEDEHQQYLHKNPGGYCGLGGLDVACPVGLTKAD